MQLSVHRTISEINPLAEEWNDLLSCCSASHVPFLRHEYLTTWWHTLGGGEWSKGELFVVTAREEDGQLVGVAPLFFTDNREGEPAMMLLGSIEISDYLDLIAPRSALPTFTHLLLELLASPIAPAWKVLDLYNLPEHSPTLPNIRAAAEEFAWQYEQQPSTENPLYSPPR